MSDFSDRVKRISKQFVDAETRLGELLEQIPPKFHQENHGKIIGEKSLPIGINKKEGLI